ncbi:MAG: amylo-alpha-1,6-glucosidase, partial [Dysgonamonadaceae bacterium]|nr:amylo-alpha-1,6-glucosidase [Dysgonamonadaceae bacterium]
MIKKRIDIIPAVCLLCVFLSGCKTGEAPDAYSRPYFDGVDNWGENTGNPYLTAGDRTYIIGTQDGLFPDLGSHVRGEMGGIWTLPVKLADGFWLKLSDVASREECWLMKADTFVNYPFGNKFIYNPILDGIRVNRMQFAPEGETGVIIQYTIENTSEATRALELDFVLKTDISPAWFSKQNGIIDGRDTVSWDEQHHLFYGKDMTNNWHVTWGSDTGIKKGYALDVTPPVATKGDGSAATLSEAVSLKPGEKTIVSYFICSSMESAEDARAVLSGLIENKDVLLSQKKALYRSVLERAKIEIPDKKLEETYNWVKINTQWLVSDLKGIGRFLGAGAVEYPWLFGCDNSYAIQGVLATSDFELAKSTLLLLKNVSERANGNGRIIHEMSAGGFVYNEGNTQETAHFIMAAWQAFLWTGDLDFLKELYPYIKQGIQWLTVEMDTNRNLFPEGYGIVEVHDLNAELIDVAVYTQQALEVTSEMALLFGEQTLAADFQLKADRLKEKINTLFWDEKEGLYCDFYGTKEQAISVTKGAIRQVTFRADTVAQMERIQYYNSLLDRLAKLPDNTEGGWFTNKNWVINTPMETGIAPVERAIRSLDIIRRDHCGEYGPYLYAVEKNMAMTISTGVQAMSEARYGRTDQMLWYVNCIAGTLHLTLPGSINEMMPSTRPGAIPSYMFHYGCPVQAWTIYGVATPIITHIFGVSPDAYRKQVVFEPHLPSGWKDISLSNLR